jgi:hypothetical protein
LWLWVVASRKASSVAAVAEPGGVHPRAAQSVTDGWHDTVPRLTPNDAASALSWALVADVPLAVQVHSAVARGRQVTAPWLKAPASAAVSPPPLVPPAMGLLPR